MTPAIKTAFEFRPLTEYSMKDRLFIRLAGFGLYLLLNAIGKTLRYELIDEQTVDEIFAGFDSPILCSYHDRLFAGAYYLRRRRVIVMTSNSKDGELSARAAQRLGFGMVRGSSSRGGQDALLQLAALMREGSPVFMTVDGPRGPRHKAKPGAPMLARITGKSMLPIMLCPEKYWTLRSWDKMVIPKPFSRVVAMKGDPIFVRSDASRDYIESKRAELEAGIDSLLDRCHTLLGLGPSSSSGPTSDREADKNPATRST